MIIESKQGDFELREWELTDCSSLAEHINNIKIWNNVRDGLPHPYTLQDAESYIRMVQTKPFVQDFAIVIDGKAVGGIGIVPMGDVERVSAEIGYWLGEAYWNRGIMGEVIRLVVNYTFRETKILRLFACVYEYNIASMKVLEKAGFTKLTVLPKAAIKNGKVIDMHYYNLVKA